MRRSIFRATLFFVLIASCGSIASAWQPNGWLYRSGSSEMSVEKGDWFWNEPSWDHWVVGMNTGNWQNTPVDGWCYYMWPYFWSHSQQQWYYTDEPGTEAWSVNLRSGEWSIYGDADVNPVPVGQLFVGEITGVITGEFLAVVGPDQTASIFAHDQNNHVFVGTAEVGLLGLFNLDLEGFTVIGNAYGQSLAATGIHDELGTIEITGSLIDQGDSVTLSGHYSGSAVDGEGSVEHELLISPDGRVFYYENHSTLGGSLGLGTIATNGAYQVSSTWGDYPLSSVMLEGNTLSATNSNGTTTLERQLSFEPED